MRLFILALAAALLAVAPTSPVAKDKWIEPVEAIRAANDDPEYGIRGHFVLTVKAIGSQDKWTYLNSEKDYRDQRCLTVDLETSLVPDLEKRLGLPLEKLKGRRIVVLGVAKRVQIFFFENGRPTRKYYYQTHVRVAYPTQVELAD